MESTTTHHAGRLVLRLAERVAQAETQLHLEVKSTEHRVDWVRRHLESGGALNSLGEMQARGAAFDVAVSRLEEAAAAFELVLGAGLLDTLTADEREWFDGMAERS